MRTVDIIQEILDSKNIKPSKMAADLGFSSGLFSQWKSGKQKVSLEKIVNIADYFDCSVDYLLGRTESLTINGNNNINQQYIGGNATANISTADSDRSDADAQELLKMIESLSLVQKAEIILKINEMSNGK